ncbi:armadillo-like helical domain-containing protein 4 isoform X2 [Paroedura picta]|uniref:armadillo-like helical domain-containing protein 4 isoform X2 n=1 Tax=Paroedura picta TaxID=143630 RepID=UPI004055B00F
MNESTASPARLAICLALLGSCCLQCLSFQNTASRPSRPLQQQAALAGNSSENTDDASSSTPEGPWGLPEKTLGAATYESPDGASAEPPGISLNAVVKATPQTIRQIWGLSAPQGFPVYATVTPGVAGAEILPAPSEPRAERKENGSAQSSIAPGVMSPDPNVTSPGFSSSARETTEGAGEGARSSTGSRGGDIFAPSILEEGGSIGQDGVAPLTTEDSLLWPPTEQSPSLPPSAGQSLEAEQVSDGPGPSLAGEVTGEPNLASTEASFGQTEDTSENWGRVPFGAAAPVRATALPIDDWDDTKPGAAGQGRGTPAVLANRYQMGGEPATGEGREEDEDDEVKRVLPPRVSATTVKGSQALQAAPVQESERWGEPTTLLAGQGAVRAAGLSPKGQVPPARAVQSLERVAETQGAAVTIDTTKSEVFQTLRHAWRGVTQEVVAAVHEIEAVLSATTPGGFPREEAAGEGSVRELVTHLPKISRSSVVPETPEDVITPVSPSAAGLFVIPAPEGGGPFEREEDDPTGNAPATPAGLLTGAIPGATVATPALPSVPASARRATIPAAHQVTTAAAYSLEGLESEEEEEEEEDEEEEEEEPDEEEEEEDDDDEEEKDANSMDDSLDGDADLAGFTLPGETSQDPLESLEDPVGELSGVSYQVPGAIEWERQNQGLVRNWMKKLKDKAGYMSGMLVPVGVGIAGALMILVTLYSVKIMNRRRRNGFKRQKQKREFNSMQDRVMLLADSSEDEF